MSHGTNDVWPSEIRLKDKGRLLAVCFEDGTAYDLAAEYLRVMSPSAEVQGHAPGQRKTVAGKRTVAIADISSVGNYAIRLTFDDQHMTGIYTWAYLAELGRQYSEKWAAYLAELSQKGFSRDYESPEAGHNCGSGGCAGH